MMSSINLNRFGLQYIQKRLFVQKTRPFKERMRMPLEQHKNKRLVLTRRQDDRPNQYKVPQLPPQPTPVKQERKLPSLAESASPYHKYPKTDQSMGTYYDPLFNPNLHEQRDKIDPDEEPFNAIYRDSQSEASREYTEVRNVTTPELWEYVERLARIKIAPMPKLRKANEPVKPLPSGFVPPPETPPDLPYFIPRTRNYLLPVYYHIHSDPDKCTTSIINVSGDLWKLEEDLRNHLEKLLGNKRRVLSSVQEPDARILFRGRWIHETVDWLHAQGF